MPTGPQKALHPGPTRPHRCRGSGPSDPQVGETTSFGLPMLDVAQPTRVDELDHRPTVLFSVSVVSVQVYFAGSVDHTVSLSVMNLPARYTFRFASVAMTADCSSFVSLLANQASV